MRFKYTLFTLIALLLLTACSPLSVKLISNNTTAPSAATSTTANASTPDTCPSQLNHCQTPHSMRIAYGVESLRQHGFTGKGQTVVDIVSFGAPNIQRDIDVFDKQFGLPPITIKTIAPLNQKEFDPNHDKGGWAIETTLDVEIIHAIAPDAAIIVLASPVAETEATIGLPEFRQLIQYAIDHHLGNIISNSWGASEATLKDPMGRQEIQKWDTLLKQSTTQQGITYFAGSGDHGATDAIDLTGQILSPTPTSSFINDDPWVTSVGGTTLLTKGQQTQEEAWNGSGGGFSAFFPTPTYQKILPASVQILLQHRRGLPDVAANADPATAMAIFVNGQWRTLIGGTSASTPLWAALGAIANQIAGHPLGFINPALYKVAMSSIYTQAFHEITIGNNTTSNGTVIVKGYSAVAGWNPVTGLGSPNAEVLLPALVAALK